MEQSLSMYFRHLGSTQRKDGASKTSPTCYPPNTPEVTGGAFL